MKFEALLKPVFAAGGSEFRVRNGGIGNTKTVQAMLCLEAQLGDDCDVVVRSESTVFVVILHLSS